MCVCVVRVVRERESGRATDDRVCERPVSQCRRRQLTALSFAERRFCLAVVSDTRARASSRHQARTRVRTACRTHETCVPSPAAAAAAAAAARPCRRQRNASPPPPSPAAAARPPPAGPGRRPAQSSGDAACAHTRWSCRPRRAGHVSHRAPRPRPVASHPLRALRPPTAAWVGGGTPASQTAPPRPALALNRRLGRRRRQRLARPANRIVRRVRRRRPRLEEGTVSARSPRRGP